MGKELIHLYGPFSINSYGVFIVLGLILFLWAANRHPLRKKLMSAQAFTDLTMIGTLVGIIGGRALYVLNEWPHMSSWMEAFAFWNGGLSILGSVIAIITIMPFYFSYYHIPILPTLDIAALHAPLFHAVARLGCFFAGCCYGLPSTSCLAVTYTSSNTVAPLFTPLHPTQLYSSAAMLLIFAIMFLVLQKKFHKPGQLICSYLMLISIERFALDFLRGDTDYHAENIHGIFSTYQSVSLALFVAAACMFTLMSMFGTAPKDTPTA